MTQTTPKTDAALAADSEAGGTKALVALCRELEQAAPAVVPAEPAVSHSALAGMILTHMGYSTSPSLEPGADERRDRLAEKLAGWLAAAPAAPQPAQADQAPAPAPDRCPACGSECNERDELVKAEREIKRLAAALKSQAPDHAPDGWALAPDYRGYANLGTGQYVLNHSAAGEPPEVIISIATEEEKAGRAIGEERDNPPGHVLQPDEMAVRLRFASPAGLAALEREIQKMRETHGWEVPAPAVAHAAALSAQAAQADSQAQVQGTEGPRG